MTIYAGKKSDAGFWKKEACCLTECPVHTDVRGYVQMIAAGKFEDAYRIARSPNPIASICGRICYAPCETRCRRNALDRSVAIRPLKRFISEMYGPESSDESEASVLNWLKEMLGGHHSEHDGNDVAALVDPNTKGEFAKVTGKKVAIVGSGPAGLSAAHDLSLMGFKPVIYEMEPVAAGMLSVGIPEYRLPRKVIQKEVDIIKSLGVEILLGVEVGKDITLEELISSYDAVILATGAKQSRRMSIPGSDAKGILGGVEFLREVALGASPSIGMNVVVIGGGNVAMDTARTAVRIKPDEEVSEMLGHYVTLDATKAARSQGGRRIHVVYRRTEEEMPADYMEYYEAKEEHVEFHFLTDPVAFEKDADGNLTGVRCVKMRLGDADESGRRKPERIEGSEFLIECDHVIMSIGQSFDLKFIDEEKHGIKMGKNGIPESNPDTQETTKEGVYVAGDLAHGTKLAIHAVASGKKVARQLYEKFMGKSLTPEEVEIPIPLPNYERDLSYQKLKRVELKALPAEKRMQSLVVEVEQRMSEEEAINEAKRCFDCSIQTIFNPEECMRCESCVDTCPMECLRLADCDDADLSEEERELIRQATGDGNGSMIIKNKHVCIRCGMCASTCPAGAITMEKFDIGENVRG